MHLERILMKAIWLQLCWTWLVSNISQCSLLNNVYGRGDDLALAHLKSAMNQHWRQAKSPKINEDDRNEISFIAFGGTCFLCKQKGHKANTCPKKNSTNHGNTSSNNSNGGRGYQRFSGKCSNCGKTGHISANCWQKEENKDVWLCHHKSADQLQCTFLYLDPTLVIQMKGFSYVAILSISTSRLWSSALWLW